jgi:hypothetical protein
MKRVLLAGLLILGLIIAVSRPTQSGKDQTQAWADYKRAVAEQERIDKEERARIDAIVKERADNYYAELKAKYPVGKAVGGGPPIDSDSKPISKPIFQPMPETDCSHDYFEPTSYSSRRQEQPDLSGLYYERTIVGPNAGQWSIKFVSGP